MKKTILFGLLSVAALAWCTSESYALFGLFHHCCGCGGCGHGCNRCTMTVCVRPYNAFSPVCCGNLFMQGCGPMFGGNPCCDPCCGPTCMPSCFNDCCGSSCSNGCCDGGCLPSPGHHPGGPGPYAGGSGPVPVPQPNAGGPPNPMPSGPPVPNFTPPAPAPLPTSHAWPYGYNGVQTAAYRPNYYGYPQVPYYGYPQAPYYGYQPGYYPMPYPMMPASQAPGYWYGNGQNP